MPREDKKAPWTPIQVGRCRLPVSKLAWLQRLKMKCDEPLSNFAFKFNLRLYILSFVNRNRGKIIENPIHGDEVGRCRLTVSNLCKKCLWLHRLKLQYI